MCKNLKHDVNSVKCFDILLATFERLMENYFHHLYLIKFLTSFNKIVLPIDDYVSIALSNRVLHIFSNIVIKTNTRRRNLSTLNIDLRLHLLQAPKLPLNERYRKLEKVHREAHSASRLSSLTFATQRGDGRGDWND